MDNKKISDAAISYDSLIKTIHTLRAPGGCPWDREQTPLSIRRDLIEETFEAVDAISAGDARHAKEELGDVILNASMMMYMYEQNGDFSVADALDELTEKLIRRHPHVFAKSEGAVVADGKAKTAEQVLNQWDKIKAQVEHRGDSNASILDEVPKGFPPLLRAYKMQKKAAKRGFDWKTLPPVEEKIREELSEVNDAVRKVRELQNATTETQNIAQNAESEAQNVANETQNDADGKKTEPFTVASNQDLDKAQSHLEEEFGDLLFAVVNYARHLGVDPEIAMSRVNKKFYRRFKYVEQKMKERGIQMDSSHLADEDALWEEAKKLGL